MIPCNKCLTLAICKSIVRNHVVKNNIEAYASVLMLCDRCSLIRDYIKPGEAYEYELDHRRESIWFWHKMKRDF